MAQLLAKAHTLIILGSVSLAAHPQSTPGIWGIRKEDRKIYRPSITTSTPGFEKLSAALSREIKSERLKDFFHNIPAKFDLNWKF